MYYLLLKNLYLLLISSTCFHFGIIIMLQLFNLHYYYFDKEYIYELKLNSTECNIWKYVVTLTTRAIDFDWINYSVLLIRKWLAYYT